ncbi:hypothetical protein M569_05899 [Genlisea aurea]|uniref:Uncharacterized protein n=1 Tax=Genlisea aurea TaxID=192259 RepID=S8CP17_9LAMI|nr:hypothetical protein M569_05899 [Genlisea aurea]
MVEGLICTLHNKSLKTLNVVDEGSEEKQITDEGSKDSSPVHGSCEHGLLPTWYYCLLPSCIVRIPSCYWE